MNCGHQGLKRDATQKCCVCFYSHFLVINQSTIHVCILPPISFTNYSLIDLVDPGETQHSASFQSASFN